MKLPDLTHVREKQSTQVHKLFFDLSLLAVLPKTCPQHRFDFHQTDKPPTRPCLLKKMHYEKKDGFQIQFAPDQKQLLSLSYQLGYYYDADAKIDSALKYFNWIIDNYPESPQYINAKQRAETLNFVLTTINADTLNIKEEN